MARNNRAAAAASAAAQAASVQPSIEDLIVAEWQHLFEAKKDTAKYAEELKRAAGGAGKAALQIMFIIREDVVMIEVKETRRPTLKSTASAEKAIALGLKLANEAGLSDKTIEDVQALIRRFARMDVAKRTAVLSKAAGMGINAMRKVFTAVETGNAGGEEGGSGEGSGEGKTAPAAKDLKEPELAELLASVTGMGDRVTWLQVIALVQEIGVQTSAELLQKEVTAIDKQQAAKQKKAA